MEVDRQGLRLPLKTRSNLSLFKSSQADSSKAQKLPKATRDSRFRKSPLSGRSGKVGGSKVRIPGITGSKPLVPAGERRSGGHDGNKAKRDTDGDKWNITPDGGSAGREGRHFTVANVGNGGKIFLRPTIRPANQRYPQPNFVFPATPPGTTGLDSFLQIKKASEENSELLSSQWTPTPLSDSSSLGIVRKKTYFDLKAPKNRSSRRAMSDSTIHAPSIAQEGEAGVFKVIISKPQDGSRSKTAEDLGRDQGSLLQVSIPSWKLGTPRFTLRGTPLIRGSSYAPTEDFRSSNASFFRPSVRDLNSLHPDSIDSIRQRASSTPHIHLPSPGLLSPTTITAPRYPHPLVRSAYLSTHLVIEPSMFDSLTFKPACDDRSIVRYSSTTGAVTAATPPRLVAEITSPSFLDYELISDFFLTFRAFIETKDLLRMLVSRLRWAVSRDDETGMVVRVRTFVAMRHWILNYFVDDFVVDYHLRVMFCNLINDFVEELSQDEKGRKVQLKILAELKKCWRRVCTQFWDGPEFDSSLGPDIPIAPGGIAGHRDPSLDPSFWETDSEDPPQIYDLSLPENDPYSENSFYADVSKAGHIDSILLGGVRPDTPEEERPTELQRRQTSPISIASLDVVSCSFPTKAFRMADPNSSSTLAAHPVDPSSIYTNADPVAPTPRALTGKRVRPHTSHRRNNSLTDSLREHGSVTEKVVYKNAEFLLTLPYAGSLVRGNVLPPTQAFVDVDPPGPWGTARQTTVFQPHPTEGSKVKGSGSAMSGQGMRKLIGGVRRALSMRGQGVLPTHGNLIDIVPIGARGATTNRIPGTAVVPQTRSPRPNGPRAPVRIDILGATIAEDFKKAVREDAIVVEEVTDDGHGSNTNDPIEYSPAHLDSSFELKRTSDGAITTGSKSIVIVDGTLPGDYPPMTGALTAWNPSVEAFAESMMRAGGADLTPPTTPPGHAVHGGTPRRSSYLLGQHAFQSSTSTSPLPPFVPDMDTLGQGRSSEETNTNANANANTRASVKFVAQSPIRPPLSYVNRHQRQQSSRSYRSRGSTAHRRWASFQSGIAAQSTIRSFDATTYSEGSVASEVMPPPLRVLRRRPGGDLRGVTNVHDLDAPLHRSRSYGRTIRKAASVPNYYPLIETNHATSFEAEAQKLAQIPDDVDDDGGVESALLKLEGKYERRIAKLSMEPSKLPPGNLKELKERSLGTPEVEHVQEEKRKHRQQHIGEEENGIVSPLEENFDIPLHGQSTLSRASEVVSFLSEDSRETYNSIPLLDRGLTDDERSKTAAREWANHSILIGPDTPQEEDGSILVSSQHPSYEFVQKTESINKIKPGATTPEDVPFLDVDSDNESDLSSEMSGEMPDTEDYIFGEPHSPKRPSPINTGTSPDTEGGVTFTSRDKPPSPPMTLTQASRGSLDVEHVPQIHEHQLWAQKPLPPTPDTTPTTAMYRHGSESPKDPTGTEEALRNAPRLSNEGKQKNTAHLPFILAFDSEILAQQFTLIEKDALNEVDWRELIDMRWKNSNNDSRSWVDFLRNTDAHGVEVVVARFNIMVKWVVSEIVLTQNVEERARCIIKFLHIAVHCRKYRNFATMSQITIALTSNEVARLARTWAMVPPTDLKTMRDLETLVSPTRNFYNIRAEMEGPGDAADMGCIPFVGIYIHDLLYNSQRPSEIASSPTTAPLVNFERCRIAASVVKTLLRRLLEASTHYQFQPIEGITERCLWMSALSDEDIRKHSESLE
ncbi:Guanine nucleotide exchange factor LTE1 [Daldinia childiae]|uniref:Guanine nucleotide exchange factor LTE1 n=1 Tax=Daldinia childiae TaxID=326645 RepID=UPI0014488338|nr:Guanine nucleotide exchange factor LTE1 [Daldinia childiae]KAF3071107.1 Guanine nucleotide exchange factor LTE1 [Daldinia childiae]